MLLLLSFLLGGPFEVCPRKLRLLDDEPLEHRLVLLLGLHGGSPELRNLIEGFGEGLTGATDCISRPRGMDRPSGFGATECIIRLRRLAR